MFASGLSFLRVSLCAGVLCCGFSLAALAANSTPLPQPGNKHCLRPLLNLSQFVTSTVVAEPDRAREFANLGCQCSRDHQQAIGAGLAQASKELNADGKLDEAERVEDAACVTCDEGERSPTVIGFGGSFGIGQGQEWTAETCERRALGSQGLGAPSGLFTINSGSGGGGGNVSSN